MNKILGIIAAVIVVAGGIYFFTRMPQPSTPASTTQNTTTQSGTTVQSESNTANDTVMSIATQGRVVFSMTDAALDMSTISSINITVSEVDVHSADNGWLTTSTMPRTYNLLDLNAKNQNGLLAEVGLKAGTYDQVRLIVGEVSITTKSGVTTDAKLPSGELKINTILIVKNGATSSANFDVLADQSLHQTGSGTYIFAPVIKTETRSDTDTHINADHTVTIRDGGHLDNTGTVGMDIDGTMKVNFMLDNKTNLDIGTNGVIKIKGLLGN